MTVFLSLAGYLSLTIYCKTDLVRNMKRKNKNLQHVLYIVRGKCTASAPPPMRVEVLPRHVIRHEPQLKAHRSTRNLDAPAPNHGSSVCLWSDLGRHSGATGHYLDRPWPQSALREVQECGSHNSLSDPGTELHQHGTDQSQGIDAHQQFQWPAIRRV